MDDEVDQLRVTYEIRCSAVISWFSTAMIGAFRSSLLRSVVPSTVCLLLTGRPDPIMLGNFLRNFCRLEQLFAVLATSIRFYLSEQLLSKINIGLEHI